MCFIMLEGLLLVWIFTTSLVTTTPLPLDGDFLDLTKLEEKISGYGQNRSDYDKEIHVDKYGIFIGIKFLDLTKKSKGARADIRIEDLNTLFPLFKMGLVKVSFRFDGGHNPVDTLFEITIDYEFHNRNTEQGTLRVLRTKDGKTWTTKLSLISKNNLDLKITPEIEILLKSIYKTKDTSDQEITIQSNQEMVLKKMYFNIDRNLNSFAFSFKEKNPDERFIEIDAEYDGKKYKFHADWDLEHELDLDFTVNLGGKNDYKIDIRGDDLEFEDFEVRAILRFQNRDILDQCRDKYDMSCWYNSFERTTLMTSNWKGNANYVSKSLKYVVNYSLPCMNATGKLELDAEFEPELNVAIDLKHMLETKQEIKLEIGIEDRKTDWMKIKEEEHHLRYILFLDYKLMTSIGIDENSPFNEMFCNNCGWKRMRMPFNMFVDKNNLFQVLLEANLVNQKNDKDLFNITIDTRGYPNKLSVYAPGNTDFGKNISGSEVAANIDFFKHLEIDNVGNETIKIEYKEMELFKITYSLTNKTETLQPPSGSPPLNIDWVGNMLKQNKLQITLLNSTIVLITEWDVTGPNGLIHIAFGDEADCKIIYRDGGWNFLISG